MKFISDKTVTIWGNQISLRPFNIDRNKYKINCYVHSPITTAFCPAISRQIIEKGSLLGEDNFTRILYIEFNKLIETVISENISDYIVLDFSEIWTSFFEVYTSYGVTSRISNYFNAEINLRLLQKKGIIREQYFSVKSVNDLSESELLECVRKVAELLKKYYREDQIILIQTRYANKLFSDKNILNPNFQRLVGICEEYFCKLLPNIYFIPVSQQVYTVSGKPLEWCKSVLNYLFEYICEIIDGNCNINRINEIKQKCNKDLMSYNGEINKDRFALFNQRLDNIKYGMNIANQYCSYDPQTFYLIMNRHLGDTLRTMRAVNAIKEYYGEKASRFHFETADENFLKIQLKNKPQKVLKAKLIKKLYIIASPSNTAVAKLYSKYIDGIITLNKEEINALEGYAYSSCAVHQNIVCDDHAQYRVGHKENTDEGQWVRHVMFGIADMEWDMCIPHKYCMSIPSVSDDTKIATLKFINEFHLNLNRSVVICPAAKSSSTLEMTLWEKYVDFLKDKGFIVFTNISGDEQPIKGTLPIMCDVDIMACLGTMGMRYISVQSGLSDVLEAICPQTLTVVFVISSENKLNLRLALNRGILNAGLTIKKNGCYCIRIEHFEEDYVLKLLMDNFH